MELIKSQTYQNLAKAFAGESQAKNRYQFIAYGAEQQELICLSQTVKDVMNQEFTHARMFYTSIQTANTDTIKNIDIAAGYPFKQKWNLVDNLKFASEDENDEATTIYPNFAAIAKEEGFIDISKLFEQIASVESCHNKLFTELYNKLKSNSLYTSPTPYKWKCSLCGHEGTSQSAWQTCPLCKAKQGYVMLNLSDN